ncbi:MAG: hypothetical protein VKP62_10755 [Candidatus Sericytochromatia bacterium]|nr:hypothetical protein [Candidatus Sericytochromatia bacterium]
MSLGTQYLKENTSYIQLKTPLKNVAALLPVILDLRLLRTAQEYLGCFPLLTYVKVQRTWANQLPETNTQLWHIDIDAFRMLKAFIFLDEIDSNTGVTRFIEGSHFFEQGNYHYQDRWSEEDIENKFPFARRVTPKLAYGDMLLLDTLQLHRGARPRGRDRTAIIANFCAHPEQASGGCLDMREKDFKALHTLQKRALTT